jgi:hypothetical protein
LVEGSTIQITKWLNRINSYKTALLKTECEALPLIVRLRLALRVHWSNDFIPGCALKETDFLSMIVKFLTWQAEYCRRKHECLFTTEKRGAFAPAMFIIGKDGVLSYSFEPG